MTQEPDEDELAALRDRLHASRCRVRTAYDRLDVLTDLVDITTIAGRIGLRCDLIVGLDEAQCATRAAEADMKDAEYALAVAMAALTVEQRRGESAA